MYVTSNLFIKYQIWGYIIIIIIVNTYMYRSTFYRHTDIRCVKSFDRNTSEVINYLHFTIHTDSLYVT